MVNDHETVTVGGTRLDLLTTEHLHRRVRDALTGDQPMVLASSNLDHVFRFGRGGGFKDPAARADTATWLVTADGVPIVRAARWLTGRSWPQLAGSDLLPGILRLAAASGSRVGFIGGFDDQHAAIASTLASDLPALEVAGYWAPSRAELDDPVGAAALAESVASAAVDLLVVGLGKPRQELWLADHVEATGASVALAFGASADFLAGTATRAPEAWRHAGLEWLYRLLNEPRRLWRRYLLEGPIALWRVLRWSARA